MKSVTAGCGTEKFDNAIEGNEKVTLRVIADNEDIRDGDLWIRYARGRYIIETWRKTFFWFKAKRHTSAEIEFAVNYKDELGNWNCFDFYDEFENLFDNTFQGYWSELAGYGPVDTESHFKGYDAWAKIPATTLEDCHVTCNIPGVVCY